MNLVCIARGEGLIALLLAAPFVSAQGIITVLNTGGGQPLVSEVRPVFVDAAVPPAQIAV